MASHLKCGNICFAVNCFIVKLFTSLPTCVSSDMALQKPRSGEELSTELALAVLVVCPQVHGVGRHGHIDFAAGGTLLCLRVTERPSATSRSN